MKPAFYIHAKTKEKFPCGEYANHGYGGLHRGAMDLPTDGYPYSLEYDEEKPKPKFNNDDELEDVLHNLMCFYHYEDIETLSLLKVRAKNGIDAYPNYFSYRFMVSAINLITQEVASWCNEFKKGVFEHPLSKDKLTDVVIMMATREETGLGADVTTKVISAMMKDETMSFADAYERSLPVMVAEGELETLVKEVLAEFPKKVEEYKKGKKGIAGMFVGEVMKKKKGLDPKAVVRTIEQELEK